MDSFELAYAYKLTRVFYGMGAWVNFQSRYDFRATVVESNVGLYPTTIPLRLGFILQLYCNGSYRTSFVEKMVSWFRKCPKDMFYFFRNFISISFKFSKICSYKGILRRLKVLIVEYVEKPILAVGGS